MLNKWKLLYTSVMFQFLTRIVKETAAASAKWPNFFRLQDWSFSLEDYSRAPDHCQYSYFEGIIAGRVVFVIQQNWTVILCY